MIGRDSFNAHILWCGSPFRKNIHIPSALIHIYNVKAVVIGRKAIEWTPRAIWILLSLRLLIATSLDNFGFWPMTVFAAGCFSVGLAWNRTAIIAWLIVTPVIVACAFFDVLSTPEPAVLGFCYLSVGLFIRNRSFCGNVRPPHVFWLDGLATWISVGTLLHCRYLLEDTSAIKNLLSHAVFGFDDPLFTLTNTHLWLSAWILYRTWLSLRPTKDCASSPWSETSTMDRTPVAGISKPSSVPRSAHRLLAQCVPSNLSFGLPPPPIAWMGLWSGVIALAWLTQRYYLFPDQYFGFIAFAPFEDIHAFGSVIGAIAIGMICSIRLNRWGWGTTILAICSIMLVALSYSRAAWLWVSVAAFGVICIRCPFKVSVLLVIIGLGVAGILHRFSAKLRLDDNSYSTRVADLLQIERWSQHDATRLQYYRASVGLIRICPWFGHGTGSSRRVNGDFIHDFILQIATENGLPAAWFLLMGLGGAILPAVSALRRRVASIETCALFSALLTYLGTQITANSINIYSTQVFFFWPLLAMLYLSAREDLETDPKV